MKFRNKIAMAFSLILLLAMGVLSTVQYLQVRTDVEAIIERSVAEIVSSVGRNIESDMALKRDLTENAARLLEQADSDAAREAIISTSVIRNNFLLSGVGYEADGRLISNDPTWQPADYDPRQRPWYRDARARGDVTFTAPYQDAATGETLVSAAAPLYQAGSLEGVVFVDVSLKGLAELVNRVSLFESGYAFLIGNDGHFIAHPDASLNGQPAAELFGDEFGPGKQRQQLSVQGESNIIIMTPLQGLDWKLGVVLDKARIYAVETRLLNSSVLYTVLALFLGLSALLLVVIRLMKPLQTLNDAMQEVAGGDGDLSRTLNTDTDLEFAQLASAFNLFTDKLRQMVVEVKRHGDSVLAGGEQTSSGAARSAAAMDQQLRELEQLAAAMNEMAASATQVAGNAQTARRAVQQADNAVMSGVEVVGHTAASIAQLSTQIDDTVQVVGQLADATANIESILEVITGIAEQTNLLALNAAIEAARAGDSGRGFAVVADEVRSLAQRTQQSTSEIRAMIDRLTKGASSASESMVQSKEVVQLSVKQAEQATAVLNDIHLGIQQITEMNLQIATAAEQQSAVAEEINRNATNIRDISQQVASETEETHRSIDQQVQSVKLQHEVLSHFRV
ncbi:methyl-accepting chemotaxis protein [Marinobacterium jannaschii]|uniref:methyl-accepting chemotaxis protein n=1 Tax=Marinobacterium jannaschii TaxID=64970 RepID=UPI000489A9A0|nr:methyl-accepting chemotaxis protein [Marinobacterium jannaschii]